MNLNLSSKSLPCFMLIHLLLNVARNATCNGAGSNTKSSSLPTDVDRVRSTAWRPVAAKYRPDLSRKAIKPP